MRYDTVIEELSASPLYLLGVFGLFLLILHVLLIRAYPIGDIAWKRVDYLWLGAAGLGLLATSAQSDHLLARRYAEFSEAPRTATTYQVLYETLNSYPGLCDPRSQGTMSDGDFAALKAEQQSLCAWARGLAARMPKKMKTDFPRLADTPYEQPKVGENHFRYYVKEVVNAAQAYKTQQERYAQRRSDAEMSHVELVFAITGPLFLAFALALRITKVSGEIAIAKRKSAA